MAIRPGPDDFGVDDLLIQPKGGEQLTGLGVPDAQDAAPGCQLRPIGREHHAEDRAAVGLDESIALVAGYCPKTDHPVDVPRNNALIIL